MKTSYSRGHEIVFIKNNWYYADDLSIYDDSRPCKRCGCYPTKEGYDACLGHIQGAKHACCGHGVEKGYVILEKEDIG